MKHHQLVLLGATGSIGQSTLEVVRHLKERVSLLGISGYHNFKKLLSLAEEFRPPFIAVKDREQKELLAQQLSYSPKIFFGREGLIELATLSEATLILLAISGTEGLYPALAALEEKKDLAIASKEILVMAGAHIMKKAREKNVVLFPVDSEHNALFQCLEGKNPKTLQRLILTCSGGPFRTLPSSEFKNITPQAALKHPTWQMGKKITLDSATLFNKALEMIEAMWLFEIPIEKIDVLIHPQSIIHSMVEFIDGASLAQLSHPSMTLPIQYALTYPERIPSLTPSLRLEELGKLTFESPRHELFPALKLAWRAGKERGLLPTILNAANETAATLFFEEKITFPEISEKVEQAMNYFSPSAHPSLEEILAIDKETRIFVRSPLL